MGFFSLSKGGSSTLESKWKNKKWGIAGDSNSNPSYPASDTKYHALISAEKGIAVNVKAINGSGWTPNTTNGRTIHEQIPLLDADADLITFLAGGNDVGAVHGGRIPLGTLGDLTTATFYGSIDYTLNAAVTKWPDKTIACISQFKRGEGKEETIQKMVKALKEVAGKYGIPVLDLYNGGNIYAYNPTFITNYMPDGVHLNNEGQKKLTSKISPFLEVL